MNRLTQILGRVTPGLLLFLLAPMIGELFSGNTPLLVYFNPLVFAVNTSFYGSAALLIREAALRWHKGWPTIFTLGAAYAILEEGLVVKSFFNPAWPALGQLAHYGRWQGVSWLWVVQLVLQHAVISIAIPILLVGIVYPDRRNEPWVGPVKRRLLWVLLAGSSLVIYLIIPYRVPPAIYVLFVLAAAVIVLVARFVPRHLLGRDSDRNPSVPGPRPLWYLPLGFAGVVGMYALPQHLLVPAAVDFFVVWLAAAIYGVAVVGLSKRGLGWGDRHRLSLASGAIAFYFALAPLRGGPTGILVALIGVGCLVWLGRRTRRSSLQAAAPAPAPG